MAWGFLKQRVVIATLGALVVGGAGSAVGFAQVYHPAPATASRSSNSAHGSSGLIGSIGAGPSATDTPASAPPTDTPIPPAPPTPRPTATPPVPGTHGQIQGRVVSVNTTNNTFVVSQGGVHYTVSVGPGTAWSGICTTLSQLAAQPNYSVDASVQGTWATATSLQAGSGAVDTQNADN